MSKIISPGILLSIVERQVCEFCFLFTERIIFLLWRKFHTNVDKGGEYRAVRRCGECDSCDKLEGRPIMTNQELWSFDIRSKDINWKDYVVPLASRGKPVHLGSGFPYLSSKREVLSDEKKREVLVCHDMMGNYLEDRFYHSVKFDDYRFIHWAGVDYFCYFSHNYVTIPPCGWINAAHSHGVKVLGTFITENPRPLMEVLRSESTIEMTISALVRLCKHFHFEGWLLNIECRVEAHLMEKLFYFVEKLRERVKQNVQNGTVFWYDSVINTGDLRWQNEINHLNVRFFKLADATLINYNWNERSLQNTSNVLQVHGESESKSFFGIDIFGRGQVAKFKSKQTLAKIFKTNFSVGFFAPGWTFETLGHYRYNVKAPNGSDDVNNAFLMRNEKFWWSLWEYLPTHVYTQLPLLTDFCVGSGKWLHKFGKKTEGSQFFNLSKQSLQPSVPLYNCIERHFDDAYNGGSCLKIVLNDSSFRLFATDYQIDGTLVFAYAFKLDQDDGQLDCILRLESDECVGDCLLFLGDYPASNSTPGRCYMSAITVDYSESLKTAFQENGVSVQIPIVGEGIWKVRYYIVNFDTVVQVKDVGVLYRKSATPKDSAYLGAVYLNNVGIISLPAPSNAVHLKIKEGNLMN